LVPNSREYKYSSTFILIIFDSRQTYAKHNTNDIRKPKCLQVGLIVAGILLTFLSVSAAAISTYFLVIMTKTTTTTGKNKVRLRKTLFD